MTDETGMGEVVEIRDRQMEAAKALEKELKEFSGGLPYDRSRIIDKTQECFEEGVRQIFKAGLGLILLERHEGTTTLSLIIEQYFPGLNLRTAQRHMEFTRTMIKHPAFQPFMKVRGGYSRALTVLHACVEEEIEIAGETGELRGYSMEQLAQMPVRVLQRALLRTEANTDALIKKATEKVAAENAELQGKVADLQASLEPPGLKAAKKLIDRADDKLHEALRLLNQVDWPALAGDWSVRLSALQKTHLVTIMVGNIEDKIYSFPEPEAPAPAGTEEEK